jgi:hypothetical protein
MYLRALSLCALTLALVAACDSDSDSPRSIAPPAAGGSTPAAPPPTSRLTMTLLGRYSTGQFAVGASEVVAYDGGSRRVFVVNAQAGRIDVLDISNPSNPTRIRQLDVSADAVPPGQPRLGGVNSVAAANGLVVAVVEGLTLDAPGALVVYRANDFSVLSTARVGFLPDMVALSADGRYAVVANEGEPLNDYSVDPEGSITVVDLQNPSQPQVTQLDFRAFNAGGPRAAELPAAVRIFGGRTGQPRASVAQDLEPEYLAFVPGQNRAVVALQENNALAFIDLAPPRIGRIVALGFKDHGQAGNGIDPSDRDNKPEIRPVPVFGMYQPDAIAVVVQGGAPFVLTANEGDARAYAGFSEETRVASLRLDPTAFPNAAALQAQDQLGRLTVTNALGDLDRDGDFDRIYAFGARSMSIVAEDGSLVFDTGDELERITLERYGRDFNSNNNANNSGDSRSDDKGPEPEAIAVGTVGSGRFAFVGLERIGGVAVYDINNVFTPRLVTYVNDRNFTVPATIANPGGSGPAIPNPAVGDLGCETVLFVPAGQGPTADALLIVGNEISGTTSIYAVRPLQ